MPYPPPPGPPDVGEFQAIGKLPAPQLPDVTGHGGEFLETDGIIPQWEPVSGSLPVQTGHAGEFLTTDGVNASWATVSSGGIIAIGAVTTPTADAAVITGGNTLQLAAADGTHPGIISATGTQTLGGLKLFPEGGASNVVDVRNFGAVADDPTIDFSQAFYNAVAAVFGGNTNGSLFPIVQTTVGGIYIPRGEYYVSRPLVMPAGLNLYGDGPELTVIINGIGTASTPANVQCFSGNIIHINNVFYPTDFPTYSNFLGVFESPLVGVTGQALTLHDISTPPWDTDPIAFASSFWPLNDSWAWQVYMGGLHTNTSFGLQLWVRVDNVPSGLQFERGIIGSRGPGVWTQRGGAGGSDYGLAYDQCFNLTAFSPDGANLRLRARITTNPAWIGTFAMQRTGTVYTIESGNITPGDVKYVELSYDGNFFDFYVNGVNQGHVAATGPLIRTPWESTTIGGQGFWAIDPNFSLPYSIMGAIDSIRLSTPPDHTGTGSYTPPTAKHAWDANTLALYNWDQGPATVQPKNTDSSDNGPLLTLPALVGQTICTPLDTSFPSTNRNGPFKHYIPTYAPRIAADCHLDGLTVTGWQSASGVLQNNSWRTTYNNVWTNGTTQFGLKVSSGVSFYTSIDNCRFTWSHGYGVSYFGAARNLQTQACGIGVYCGSGELITVNQQPAFNSYLGTLFDGNGPFSTIYVENDNYDNEVWTFSRQIACGAVFGNIGTFYSINNFWIGGGTEQPAFLYFSVPSAATHVSDLLEPNTAGYKGLPAPSGIINYYDGIPPRGVFVINANIQDFNIIPTPLSNVEGFVSVLTNKGSTNLQGESISDVRANNLAGTFTIQSGYTTGGPLFLVNEPDANYIVEVTPQGFLSTFPDVPAVGSNRVVSVSPRDDGFDVTIEADPGSTCTNIFAWRMTRVPSPAALFEYIPIIPSTVTNPLSGQDKGLWGIGVTVVPTNGNALGPNSLGAINAIISEGTIGTTDSWEIALDAGYYWLNFHGGTYNVQVSFPRVVRGKLVNILNPGAHNFVFSQGLNALFIDGLPIVLSGTSFDSGTQQAQFHVGERADTTKPLTAYTLRNLKMDRNYTKCFSDDNAIGPARMAQSCIIGDNVAAGIGSQLDVGGWATQLQNSRYGTTYYWAATGANSTVIRVGAGQGLVDDVWAPWAGASTAPPLRDVCIIAGASDLLYGGISQAGATGSDIWSKILELLNGTAASALWNPPISNLGQFAIVIYQTPLGTGPDTLVVNGNSISIPFVSDWPTTTANAVSLINADAALSAIVTASAQVADTRGATLVMTAKQPGTIPNAYVCTSAGVGGAGLYGDTGGNVPGFQLSVTMIGGVDTVATIAGVPFPANFDTDINTTINNLVALVNADVTVSALVTASNDAGVHMRLDANVTGFAANDILLNGTPTNTPGNQIWTDILGNFVFRMTGGSNGALTSAIPNIVICTVPPFGGQTGYTSGKNTQRIALNTLILAYSHASVTIYDLDALLADGGDPTILNPTYGANGVVNDAGHTAILGALGPLLP